MSGWRQRVGALLGNGRATPVPQPPAAAPKPKPPAGKTGSGSKSGAATGYVAVIVLGLSGEALEQVLAIAEKQCAAKGARPVFITDGHDFEPFRRRKAIVDQVVDAEARLVSAPGLAWRIYRRRQYALLAARWRPAAVISFGRPPDPDCLAALGGVRR